MSNLQVKKIELRKFREMLVDEFLVLLDKSKDLMIFFSEESQIRGESGEKMRRIFLMVPPG